MADERGPGPWAEGYEFPPQDTDTGRIDEPPYTDTSMSEERSAFQGAGANTSAEANIPEWGDKAPPVDSKYAPLVDAAGKAAVGIAGAVTKSGEDRGNGYGPYANDPRFPNQNQPGYTGYASGPPAVASGGGGAGVVVAVGVGVVAIGGLALLLASRSKRSRRRGGE